MAGGILDPKSIQDRLETLVNQQVDQQVEGKTLPTLEAAPADPFAGAQNPAAAGGGPVPTPSAAAAPSAPAAEGTNVAPVSPVRTGYKAYYEFEYLGDPDDGADTNLTTEPMNFTAGQGRAPQHAVAGDTRSNIDKIIDGDRTASSRQYVPKFKAGDSVVLTYNGQAAALVRIKAVYAIAGVAGDEAVLQDTASGLEVRKPLAELAKSEGYDTRTYAKKLYGVDIAAGDLSSFTSSDPSEFAPDEQMGATNEALFGRAPSPEMQPTQAQTPVPGETPASVAPTAVPEAPAAPVGTPETQATATTPPDPFAGITDPSLVSGGVPPEDVANQPVYELPKGTGRRIGVIGTAGRKEKAARITKADFDAMVAYLIKAVQPNDTLVSGGAAWADHSAVRMFLDGKVSGLVLHLPAELMTDSDGKVKFDNAGFGTVGAAANYYHKQFAIKLGLDEDATMKDIQAAIDKGAVVTYGDGTSPATGANSAFKERNTLIANDADYGLIAFDFDVTDRDRPADGGTGDTWRKSKDRHRTAKRRLVDIRGISPDPDEPDRINSYNGGQAEIAERRAQVGRLVASVRAADLSADAKKSLLDKLTTTGRNGIPSERNIDDVIDSINRLRKIDIAKASRRAYLPIQKLVSAAILVAMADTGRMPVALRDMIAQGEVPNLAGELPDLDPAAALRFLRLRALQHSVERGTGDNARDADRIFHEVMLSLGVPEESLQPRTPYRPNFTTLRSTAEEVVATEKANNKELGSRMARIKDIAAKLGPLISHPDVARPLFTITELLRGVESDIGSERSLGGGTMQISRLRTDPKTKLPYMRAVEQIDPVYDYINSAEYLVQRVSPDVDPYLTALAVAESRSLPPETRGEGDFAYDEAQLMDSYGKLTSGRTEWRRYALDIGGEVPQHFMDLDELGLVTDKFDGFQNKYAELAMPIKTYGVPVSRDGVSSRSRYNRSRATIGMHVSTDASAGINWNNRAVGLEVHVVRALKKLLAGIPGADIMGDTPDELAIVKSAFIPYTKQADVVTGAVKNITTAVNSAVGQVYLVDLDELPDLPKFTAHDASGMYVKVGGKKYYVGKGFYAFREGDPDGDALLEVIYELKGYRTSRRTEAFSIGDLSVEYPASVIERVNADLVGVDALPEGLDTYPTKTFRVTVDPVVHQTFSHTDLAGPLVRADGRPFKGDYRLSDGTMYYLSSSPPSHAYDDSNQHLIEFDEGLRFGIETPVPRGVLVDGVDLEADFNDDPEYLTPDSEKPMQLAGEASKAADRQRMLESGERVGGDISPYGRGLEYEAAAAGETRSHFGQQYAFDELDTSAADEAADPLRKSKSRFQAQTAARLKELGVQGGTPDAPATTATLNVGDFVQAEQLGPENAALAKQLLLDYMWILRLRVRDASQATPRPVVEGQPPARSTFMDHRRVAFARREMIGLSGFYDILDLHNASSRGPAALSAVISEVMDATGDDPIAANKVLSEIYQEYPAEDPRKMVSTREGLFSYEIFEPRNDLERYSSVLADEIRKVMAVERGADPKYAKSLEAMIGKEQESSAVIESFDQDLQGDLTGTSVDEDVIALQQLERGTPEFEQSLERLQTKVAGMKPASIKPTTYTTTSGVELVAETPYGQEVLDDIIARDKAGRLTPEVLKNATANMVEQDAQYKRNKIALDPNKPVFRNFDPKLSDFMTATDPKTLRILILRAWAKYSEHMAADGDYDSFVNVIKNGIKQKDQVPKLLNFVLEKVGAVKLPDNWFTTGEGVVTFPVPKVKNPKYASDARRIDALQGVLSTSEMNSFVDEALAAGTLKRSAAERLRAVIRYADQSNKVMAGKGERNKTLAFHVMGEGAETRIILTTAPTFASQKTASAPYRSTESGEGDWTTLEDSSGRVQRFSAADLQKIISAVGATDVLRVRSLPVVEGGILSQAKGIATQAEMDTASPYVIEFGDGTSIDRMVELFGQDSLDLRGGRTAKEAIVFRLLDASVRARFFGLAKGILDSAGVGEGVITDDDLDNNPFVEREVAPTEDVVRRRIEAGQTEAEARKGRIEYVVKPSVEGLESYAGPFSRARSGGSGTLSERPYGDRLMTPVLRDLRDKIKSGAITLDQRDADELTNAIDRVIEFKQQALGYEESTAASGRPIEIIARHTSKYSKLPKFTPGAKAGIIGGSLAGTLAAYLQYGADENAKQAALASLPGQVGFEVLGAIPKVGSPVAAATGLGLTYATGGDMLRAIIGIGGSIAGGFAGGALGLVSGPGAFAAGLAGSTAGYMIADNIYSAVTGKSNTSPMPQNLADSNAMQSASLEIPSRDQINQGAPRPVVNKDIAELDKMRG